MIAAMAESWVTILVFFAVVCGAVAGSGITYRIVAYDTERWIRRERERGR